MDKKITVYKKRPLKIILLLILVALNVGCDQVAKNIVRQKIDYHENISLIAGHLTLTKVENTGAFLSMGEELPQAIRFITLSLLPILVLAFGFCYLLIQNDLPVLMQVGMCFLLGGGIGNIYDRVRFGSVTDFIHADFGFFSTGVFNFADVSIMVGIGILLIQSFKSKLTTSENHEMQEGD